MGLACLPLRITLKPLVKGDNMKHMPFAAEKMTEFMVGVGFIPEGPDLTTLLDDRFVKTYAESA